MAKRYKDITNPDTKYIELIYTEDSVEFTIVLDDQEKGKYSEATVKIDFKDIANIGANLSIVVSRQFQKLVEEQNKQKWVRGGGFICD